MYTIGRYRNKPAIVFSDLATHSNPSPIKVTESPCVNRTSCSCSRPLKG